MKYLSIYLLHTIFIQQRFVNTKTGSSKFLNTDEPEVCTCEAGKKGKKKRKKKDPNIPSDGHLVSSCLVVLALVGYVNGKCIPININQFRNSHLGIKPLKYKVSILSLLCLLTLNLSKKIQI